MSEHTIRIEIELTVAQETPFGPMQVETAGTMKNGEVTTVYAEPFNRREQMFDKAVEEARRLGRMHGLGAASWWEQEAIGGRVQAAVAVTNASRVLRGMEEGDPAIMDNLPHPDLSGEWAGFSSQTLIKCCADAADVSEGDLTDVFNELCSEYEDAFTAAAETSIEEACGLVVKQYVDDNDIVTDENKAITQSDIDALFELIPAAKNALQGMDIHNTQELWDSTVLALEGQGQTITRGEVVRRVANAIRCIQYGESLQPGWASEHFIPGSTPPIPTCIARKDIRERLRAAEGKGDQGAWDVMNWLYRELDEDKTLCPIHEAGACPPDCPRAYGWGPDGTTVDEEADRLND